MKIKHHFDRIQFYFIFHATQTFKPTTQKKAYTEKISPITRRQICGGADKGTKKKKKKTTQCLNKAKTKETNQQKENNNKNVQIKITRPPNSCESQRRLNFKFKPCAARSH